MTSHLSQFFGKQGKAPHGSHLLPSFPLLAQRFVEAAKDFGPSADCFLLKVCNYVRVKKAAKEFPSMTPVAREKKLWDADGDFLFLNLEI